MEKVRLDRVPASPLALKFYSSGRDVCIEAARTAAAAEVQDIERVRDATVDGDCHGWRRARRRTWRGARCHGWILTDPHVERLRRHSRDPIVDGLPDLSVVVDLLARSPIHPAGGKPRPVAGRVRDHVQHHPRVAELEQPERDGHEQDDGDPEFRKLLSPLVGSLPHPHMATMVVYGGQITPGPLGLRHPFGNPPCRLPTHLP